MSNTKNERPHVVKNAKGKRPQFYEEKGVDHALSMIMVLANEVCVLRDRMDAYERVSKTNGVDLAKAVDELILTEDALVEREEARQGFLDRIFYLSRKEAAEAAEQETKEKYDETIDEIAKQ